MKMELIAALLHGPEVLFLDEPTIGLDVVAQHNIQTFLKQYQQQRQVTILLTSHYMKDVVALCRRVVIIAQGRIIYNGSLEGILDRFGGQKVVSLLVADGQMPDDLGRYGEVLLIEPPRAKLRIERTKVTEVLSCILRGTPSRMSASKTRRWKRSSPKCLATIWRKAGESHRRPGHVQCRLRAAEPSGVGLHLLQQCRLVQEPR